MSLIVNDFSHLQLRPAVVCRERRELIVTVPELGSDPLVLADPSGDVELLLEVLAVGTRSRTGIIREFTSKREGAQPLAVSRALDALENLGLIVVSPCSAAQGEVGLAGVRPSADNEPVSIWSSPPLAPMGR